VVKVDPRRRRLLKLGAFGAVTLALGGGALRWFAGGYAAQLEAGEVPIALSTKELAIVKAFIGALLPAEDGFPSGVALGVHQRIDEEMWATSEGTRGDLKNGLQLFEHATITHGFSSRFTSLEPAARLAYFDKLLRGEPGALQQIAVALKELAYLFYYSRDETWKVIGYDGPLVGVVKPPDSHVAYQDLLRKRRTS
jgi:hypothetical protein